MSKLLYFLATFAESGLSVFGVRGTYAQPEYRVVQTIASGIEIRDYAPRVEVETPIQDGGESAAFRRLFAYITGANTAARQVAMTVPVARGSRLIAMTVPVEMSADKAETMRFFLPASVVQGGAPVPTDPLVHIVAVPEVTMGVIRFSGAVNASMRADRVAALDRVLKTAGMTAAGPPIFLSYDPPFAIPFLRRNEVALPLAPARSATQTAPPG